MIENNQYSQGMVQTDMVLLWENIPSRMEEKQISLLSDETGEVSKVIGNNTDGSLISSRKTDITADTPVEECDFINPKNLCLSRHRSVHYIPPKKRWNLSTHLNCGFLACSDQWLGEIDVMLVLSQFHEAFWLQFLFPMWSSPDRNNQLKDHRPHGKEQKCSTWQPANPRNSVPIRLGIESRTLKWAQPKQQKELWG